MYCYNRMKAGEPQRTAEPALGAQRFIGEGRQVDLARGLLLVSCWYRLVNLAIQLLNLVILATGHSLPCEIESAI